MWAPSCPPGPAGWDRRRVGARLRAALAGLRELQGLRATQQARVRGALAMQSPPGPAALQDPARPEHPRGPRAQELRLEAALAALQEQLNRLRRQDVGLKTHLEQLDRQIGELQLDGSGPCGRAADGDSRPSSGFYELSDGGSCSLSASRTSVCSDRVYSSRDTLLPANPTARPDAGDGRPRSADETTVHGAPLPAWRPLATEEGVSRPRPVSTGDLERVLPSELELQKALQPALSCQDGTVRWPTRKGGRESPALAPGLCAQPPFADHGAFLLGLNTGHPKTKAVKVKRGATDKVQPSPGRALAAPLLPPEWGQGLGRRPVPAGAAPSRSCSEPRLYPVPLLVPLLVTRREGRRAPVQALFPLEVAAGVQVRKQQRRWLSSVEVAGGLGPPRPAVSRARGPQPGCAWARPRLPRQDARVRSESEGSEPSAKGVSLLYSTVAETSEDGASDHTSSRFGDRESSSSDSEVGAWPRACPPQPSRAPGARRPPLPPMPKLCRIKASKALRRKIRRFQPAALRVMTMV
ncbi:dapper homolog 2 isoform X2 [Mustela lutreola]|uniref:dapper homolog 2 isoform X2 n=1 Tax=Mustela lutreola TaxID=9666 RepID=UPI0027972CF5|nr:dapper homolog 2 isoform X2 [Mustela lutreola]